MSRSQKINLEFGEVTLSNGFPVQIECNHIIEFDDVEAKQTEMSLLLGMPVIIYDTITELDNRQENKPVYRLLHKDSVIRANHEDQYYHQQYGPNIINGNFEVIGLWDGHAIDELVELFIDQAVDIYHLQYIVALRSSRLHKKALKKNRVGPEEVKFVPYFLDECGNGLTPTCNRRNTQRHGFDCTVTHSLDDLFAAIADYFERSSYSYRYGIDREDQWYKDFASRVEFVKGWDIDRKRLTRAKITSEINDLPAEIERDMLQLFCLGWYCTVNSSYFHDIGLSLYDTQQYILSLVARKLLKIEGPDLLGYGGNKHNFPFNLETSESGRRIAVKRLSKRMKRKTIENLLCTVIERAKQSSELSFLKYQITSISVFGSYLNADLETYGDLDLVVDYAKKDARHYTHLQTINELDNSIYQDVELRYSQAWKMFDDKELQYKPKRITMYETLFWDHLSIVHHLKRSNHKISVHSQGEFECLTTTEILMVYKV